MSISYITKQAIRKEYKYKCQYCKSKDTKAIHVEHIKARDNGGTDDLDNLTLACESCNLMKSNLELAPEYSGILVARAKQKKGKILESIKSNRTRKVVKSLETPSIFFDNKDIRNKDQFLKIHTTEEQIKNFTILFRQSHKIVIERDESYIEYQTYKWTSLFGEQFHNTFKRMMYISVNKIEYNLEDNNFKKIGSENLITGILYKANEYVRLYMSNRLVHLIKENSIDGFADIVHGKEITYNKTKPKKRLKNPFNL
jgi:hypothetical protein